MEAEALILGNWKNIEEIEMSLNLEELEAVITAGREKEHRIMKFHASLKGINLDEGSDAKERFDAVQRRVEAKLSGKTEEELDFEKMGIDIETV